MKFEEKQKFYSLVVDVMSYYKQDTSEFTLSIFWDACKDLEFEHVAKAFNAHAKDPDKGQFAPKVADIVRLLQGTKTDRSAIAWGRVYDAMCSVGAYTDVCFDDTAIHAAVHDCGGWVKMCRVSSDELSYLQHQFCKAYQAYASRDDYEYPRVLTGDRGPDEMFAKRGLPAPTPRLLGDAIKARRVYESGELANKVAALLTR